MTDETEQHTQRELTEATASGLRWITLVRVVTEVLLLGSMVVLARLIPPSAFGMCAVALIVQELAYNVPSEGVGSALVQRRSITREHLQGAFALSLAVAAGLAALTLALSLVLIRPVFGHETALLVALTTPWFMCGAILAIPIAVLRRRLDFRRLSMLGLTQSIARSLSSIAFAAVLGLNASALVFGGLVGMVAMVALAVSFVRVPLPRWRTAEIRDLLPYGGPAALACLAWAGFRNGDYAIVGARLGVTQAGFYWRGFQLAVEYQGKVSTVMSQIAFPVLTRTDGAEAMFALRRRIVRLTTVAVFPPLALLVLLAPVAVPWLFGPAWQPAVLPAQILAGAGASTVVIDSIGTTLQASGRSRALLGYGVAHFLVYVMAVLAASSHGLAGVSIAAVSVHLVFVVVAYRVLLRDRAESAIRCLWGDIAAAAIGSLALVGAAWPVDVVLTGAGVGALAQMGLVGGVGLVAYLATLRLFFGETWSDLMSVRRRVVPARRLRAAVRRAPLAAGRAA